jgi:hypothetical protein
MTPKITYVGSPYHKRHQTRWGPPLLRSDKSPCPEGMPDQEVCRVMEVAIADSIARGWHSELRDGDWPRYVWGRSIWTTESGTIVVTWEARVINHGVPEYKAYPIERDRHADHMPFEVKEELWEY